MGYYEDRVLPRIVDKALSGPEVEEIRGRVCRGLHGEVLEVGFGSGRNVRHYPATATRVQAVDPAVAGRKLAEEHIARSSVPVEFVGLDGQHLPVDDASIDSVVITWTLCTIPDPNQALVEIRRVLRPGGTVHFVEHGISPDTKVAKWQRRLNPIQKRVFGGCHLDRPIDRLIAGAGFDLGPVDTYYAKGAPKSLSWFYEGSATKR